MSSTYRALCLGHHPALVVDDASVGYTNPADAFTAVQQRTGALAGHPNCDLLVGRFSYPLIEVACPPSTRDIHFVSREHPVVHTTPQWVATGWLRLLAAVTIGDTAQPELVRQAVADLPRCWTPARAHAVIAMLDTPEHDGGVTHNPQRPPSLR